MFIEPLELIGSVSSGGAQCGLAEHFAPNGAGLIYTAFGSINISLLWSETNQRAVERFFNSVRSAMFMERLAFIDSASSREGQCGLAERFAPKGARFDLC
jgi:hypothetical protein